MHGEDASVATMITELAIWITREDFASIATQELDIKTLSVE